MSMNELLMLVMSGSCFFRKVPSTNFSPFQPKIIYRISNVTDALYGCAVTVWRSQRVKLGQRDGRPIGWQRPMLETNLFFATWFELSWILDLIIVKYYIYIYIKHVKHNMYIIVYIYIIIYIHLITSWYVYVSISHHHIASVGRFIEICVPHIISISIFGHRLMSSRAGHPGSTAEDEKSRLDEWKGWNLIKYPVVSCQVQTQHEFQKWYI